LKPLTDLLKGGAKTLEWTVSAQEAFQNAKRLLATSVPLQHPARNAELSLATDVSDTHIGGVMQQKSVNINQIPIISQFVSQKNQASVCRKMHSHGSGMCGESRGTKRGPAAN
jgi:hypothetical protein